MFLLPFASILAVLNVFLALPSKAYAAQSSGCKLVKMFRCQSVIKCAEHGYVRIATRHVPMGVHGVRIRLESPSTQVLLYCGRYSSFFDWKETKRDANQIRVSFLEGFIHIQAFWCERFNGPARAGIRCAVEAFSNACPDRVSDINTCVFEVNTLRFSRETVRNAVQVKTEVAAVVKKSAQVSFGVSHPRERTVVNPYSVESRSYIVIPAGFRFCSFSEVYSEEDYMVSTGFAWRCKLPKFVQTTVVSGRCTDLPLCKVKLSCSTLDNNPFARGKKSTVPPTVSMLFIVSLTVVAGS